MRSPLWLIVLLVGFVAPGLAEDLPPEERFRCQEEAVLGRVSSDREEDFGERLDFDGDTLIVSAARARDGGHALVYVLEGEEWRLQAELRADDPDLSSSSVGFPSDVAIHGNLAVLGRARSRLSGRDSGVAHVFERVGEDWFEIAVLTPPDPAEDDRFGQVVGVHGDRIVVGAPQVDPAFGVTGRTGRAHVYLRSAGAWVHEARLVPTGAWDDGQAGRSVAIHGDRVALGSGPSQDHLSQPNRVTIFERGPSGWTESAELPSPAPTDEERFGLSLDLEADRLLVGAPLWSSFGGETGRAHVFVNRAGSWEHEATLSPPLPFAHASAGRAVALEGNIAVVGNPGHQRFGGSHGAAHVFRLEGGAWSLLEEVRGSSARPGSDFGVAVGLSGSRIAVGAPLERYADRFDSVDQVFVFGCRTLLLPACSAEEALRVEGAVRSAGAGQAVALDGDRFAVGFPGEGLVRVFERGGSGAWGEVAVLSAADGHAGDMFGRALGLHGETLVVGAPFHRQLGFDAGAAWIFERGPSGTWSETAFLLAPDGEASDGFGLAVDVHLDTVAIGAHRDGDRGGAAGAVHVFVRSPTGWEHQAKLTADDGDGTEQLGFDVAVFGEVVMAGAHGEDRVATDDFSVGAVYAYRRSGTDWVQEQKIEAPEGTDGDQFGISVALDGTTVLIGAWRDGYGSAYTFRDVGGQWLPEDKLFAADPRLFRRLGTSVDLEGERAILGDPHHEGGGSQAGAALVFARVDGQWHEQGLLVDSAPAIIDRLGVSVAVSGDHLAAGAPLADGGSSDAGTALLFRCESNLAPSCAAGSDLVAGCDGVVLGAAIEDPDGDPVDLQWRSDCPGVVFLPSPNVANPLVMFGESCEVDCLLFLEVEDDRGLRCRDELRVLVDDELPPTVEAPEPLVIECEGPGGIPAVDPRVLAWLGSAAAFDDCSEPALVHDAPPLFEPRCVGEPATSVRFLATDTCGNEDVATSTLAVVDTTPPELVVPAPLLLECDGLGGLSASDSRIAAWLVAASATDTCSEVSVSHDAPDFFAAGCAPGRSTTVTFTATDACGLSVQASSEVIVVDSTAPIIRRDESVLDCLWPPNGRWVRFLREEVPVEALDACDTDPPTWWFVDCFSDQPENGTGDGNGAPDCMVEEGGEAFAVRAERSGGDPSGRNYSAWVVARDSCGNESLPELVGSVHVPHDRETPREDCRRGER